MVRTILFEGKVTIAGQLVDFRIYKNKGEDVKEHYSFEINPEVKDASQATFYHGDIQNADNLDDLLFRFNQFQGMFSKIVDMRFNNNYY